MTSIAVKAELQKQGTFFSKKFTQPSRLNVIHYHADEAQVELRLIRDEETYIIDVLRNGPNSIGLHLLPKDVLEFVAVRTGGWGEKVRAILSLD